MRSDPPRGHLHASTPQLSLLRSARTGFLHQGVREGVPMRAATGTFGALVLTLALAAPLSSSARAEESIRLIIAAQPGQTSELTARTEVGVLVFAGGDPMTYQVRNEGTLSSRAERVAADGTVTWKTRIARMSYERDGRTLMQFDAEDEEASGNAAALKELEVHSEQQSDGRIRDFRVEGSESEIRNKVEAGLEESIQNSVLMYPKDPVATGQSWNVGKRTMPFPGVGRLEYQLVATLLGVPRKNGAARADIRLDAADVRFVPDADSRMRGKMSSFRLQGDAQYDIDGRFLRSQDTYGFLSLALPNPEGGTMTMQIYMRVGMEEKRGKE